MDLTANVVLGSTLHAQACQLPRPTFTVAPTGCAAIDAHALDGGFRYGEVATVAGSSGMGKTLLTYHTIYSHLRSHTMGEAVIIDTNGTFSAARLRDVFVTRLRAETEDTLSELDLNAGAVSLLDRVKFTRTFDVVGISQAVSESSDTWEARDRDFAARRAHAQANRDTVIPSSQADEDEDVEDDDVATQPYQAPPTADHGGVGLIVIDNIANHFGRELSKDPVRGQALLASFYRSLDQLTRQRRICTILVNNAVNSARPRETSHQRKDEDGASSFASVLGKPALGRSFAYLVDLSVWVSNTDATQDPRPNSHTSHPLRPGARDRIGIFEVLKDRNGAREGMWAAFDIKNETTLISVGRE